MRLFPLRFGGGYDEYQKAFRVLKSAEGIGGSAQSDDGIDGLWRRSRALALACGTSAYRRAINNAFPRLATDLLPYYERVLGVRPTPAQDDTQRREVVDGLWTAHASALMTDITTELQRIDSRFSIIYIAESKSKTSHSGGHYADGPVIFGGSTFKDCAQFGYFTTRSILRVRFAVGHTPMLPSEVRKMNSAKAKLRAILPSSWDFTITTSSGFLAGVSPLGTTGL